MKKFILGILLFLLPNLVNAAHIKNTVITNSNSNQLSPGDEFRLTFGINFEQLNEDKTGIYTIGYQIIFDDSVFSVAEITSPSFNSGVYKEGEEYYVLSIVNNHNNQHKCIDPNLYCGNYTSTIKFVVKNTQKENSTIKIGEIAVALFDMNAPGLEYTEDDIVEITDISNQSKTVVIKKEEKKEVVIPESIVTNKKPDTSMPKHESSSVLKEEKKSDNWYLKSLQIENYEIEFNKLKNSYYINVPDDINSLNIQVELEEENATYQIIGADDLNNNQRKVKIEVTALNGEKNTYTIYAVNNKDQVVYENQEKEEKKTFEFKKIYILFVVGIVLIFFIIQMIKKVKDKKIDHSLDEL